MTYDLIKYKYRGSGTYTAFCLTPKLKEPVSRVLPDGSTVSYTNKGVSSEQARHFQRPETARAWLATVEPRSPLLLVSEHWETLSATTIWPPEGSKRQGRVF